MGAGAASLWKLEHLILAITQTTAHPEEVGLDLERDDVRRYTYLVWPTPPRHNGVTTHANNHAQQDYSTSASSDLNISPDFPIVRRCLRPKPFIPATNDIGPLSRFCTWTHNEDVEQLYGMKVFNRWDSDLDVTPWTRVFDESEVTGDTSLAKGVTTFCQSANKTQATSARCNVQGYGKGRGKVTNEVHCEIQLTTTAFGKCPRT